MSLRKIENCEDCPFADKNFQPPYCDLMNSTVDGELDCDLGERDNLRQQVLDFEAQLKGRRE